MKFKLGIIGVLVAGGLFLSSSCTKMLELKPTSIITNASFWHTQDDAEGALSGMYAKLRDQTNLNLFIWGEARSEVMRWGGASGTLDYDKYYNNTINSDNAGPSWQGLYSVINAANLILKYVPGISFSSDQVKNDILAQAYTMRAFTYFVLVKTWGDVPLRQEPIEGSDAKVTQIERTAKAEVFKLIKSDLDQALQLFSTLAFTDGRNRWSKVSAYALQADVYLWTGKLMGGGEADIKTALAACNEIQKADVSLIPDYVDLFRYENKGNDEVIMAVGYKDHEASNNYFYNMYSSNDPNAVDPITGEPITASAGGVVWTVTSLVTGQFSMDDSRRAASFDTSFVPTIILKGRGTLISGVRYYTSDITLYRYADILLMKAEAENALGMDPSAEINAVRKRAYKDHFASHIFIPGTKQYNDEMILKERLLELAFEGKRWWDLIRFSKAFDLVPSMKDKGGNKDLLVWPISKSVLSLEPKIQQNPGW